MRNRNFRHNASGQVIVITALMVALVLLSTAIYVVETEKDVPTSNSNGTDDFLAYQQTAWNTLISALANATNGGNQNVLVSDVNTLEATVAAHAYQSLLQINATPLTQAPYQNGLWISCGTNGQGVSSAYVTLTLNSTGPSSTASAEYSLNVTTQIDLSGNYLQVDGTLNQVNLELNLLNEGKPALAQNFTFYYLDASEQGDWTIVNSPTVTNFYNGTYSVTFSAVTVQSGDPITVAAYCTDQRGITVGAKLTCTQ